MSRIRVLVEHDDFKIDVTITDARSLDQLGPAINHVVEQLRNKLAEHGIDPFTAAAALRAETTPLTGAASVRPRVTCTNDPVKKAAEVADGMRRLGDLPGMADLYQRGCFRHLEDVAYARIMLERNKEAVDEIATYLDASYEGSQREVKHRCDRVFPPS